MSSAISNALSGLNANANAINIVSSNLANLNTTGYKNEQVSFEDLVNASIAASSTATSVSGSTIAKSVQEFQQGSLQTTGNPYDAAIQGGGFFVLRATSGQELLTRQGNFAVDSTGHLVSAEGQYVQGWNASSGVLTSSGPATDIVLPTGLAVPPSATTNFTLSVNLNSNAAVGSANGSFSSPIQVVDAQGNSHTLTVNYTETATNTWSYDVKIPSADLTGGQGASTSLGTGTLTFDGNGQLQSPAAANGPIPLQITGLASGAADMNVTWNLYNSGGTPLVTQNTSVSANLSNTQDGLKAGQLNSVSIGTNGLLIANFSNGTTENVAQIAVASVSNPSSMAQVGGNSFVPTGATATPVVGAPATGSRGQITGGALETSTVDIATEFTNLLQYERGYQANSKVISTEDQIVQQTIALIQG
jgi:flagellar hook protein FlgE